MKFRELQIQITKITNAKFRELQIWFLNRELKDRGPHERSSGFYIINLVSSRTCLFLDLLSLIASWWFQNNLTVESTKWPDERQN